MSDYVPPDQPSKDELIGPAKDFRTFIELEFERRRSSQKGFDRDLFDQAVGLVLSKLGNKGSTDQGVGDDHQ